MMRVGLIFAVVSMCLCACAHADCPESDLNSDCRVDANDLWVLAEAWLGDPNTPADLNRDKKVNQADLAILATQWRQTGCPIVINEVLAHAHADAPDWIELYNASRLPVDIGGWMLSDRQDNLEQVPDRRGHHPGAIWLHRLLREHALRQPAESGYVEPVCLERERGNAVPLLRLRRGVPRLSRRGDRLGRRRPSTPSAGTARVWASTAT